MRKNDTDLRRLAQPFRRTMRHFSQMPQTLLAEINRLEAVTQQLTAQGLPELLVASDPFGHLPDVPLARTPGQQTNDSNGRRTRQEQAASLAPRSTQSAALLQPHDRLPNHAAHEPKASGRAATATQQAAALSDRTADERKAAPAKIAERTETVIPLQRTTRQRRQQQPPAQEHGAQRPNPTGVTQPSTNAPRSAPTGAEAVARSADQPDGATKAVPGHTAGENRHQAANANGASQQEIAHTWTATPTPAGATGWQLLDVLSSGLLVATPSPTPMDQPQTNGTVRSLSNRGQSSGAEAAGQNRVDAAPSQAAINTFGFVAPKDGEVPRQLMARAQHEVGTPTDFLPTGGLSTALGQGIDPDTLAEWVNEALANQARRHGVDLS
ncbi:MAG: hypothetical protein KDE53_26130 [Caldilineaceae bacterium]|nr:hypothetical protein [Caldilineaceae bacterium]